MGVTKKSGQSPEGVISPSECGPRIGLDSRLDEARQSYGGSGRSADTVPVCDCVEFVDHILGDLGVDGDFGKFWRFRRWFCAFTLGPRHGGIVSTVATICK